MFQKLIVVVLVLTTLLSAKNSIENNDDVLSDVAKKLSLDQLNYYEINIRHFTKEGTINAVVDHLPRLEKMGVDVLCLLPIYPIGKTQREGQLGDPYHVQDYSSINNELGTIKDFQKLVNSAHDLKMKVILDWDGSRLSKDNSWNIKKKWFKSIQDDKYAFPNYENDDLCDAMQSSMLTWVEEYNVDGFRCFNTDEIPMWYWDDTWQMLNKEKSMIALATSENEQLLENGFNVLYANGLYE